MLIGYTALALVGVWLNLSTDAPATQDTTMATHGSHTRKQDAHRTHALLGVALIGTDSSAVLHNTVRTCCLSLKMRTPFSHMLHPEHIKPHRPLPTTKLNEEWT